MSNLDIQLENLDDQLQNYTPLQRWAIYIGTSLGILAMGWMFYLSDSLDELNALQEQNSALAAQVRDNAPESYRSKISASAEAIIKEETRTASLENDKQTLLLQMASSDGMVFDNRHYAKTLDQLLEQSVRLGLKINVMQSDDSNKTFFGKVHEFKQLTITGNGNFPAIADFLTFIEAQNSLVQIQSVQISSDDEKPRFSAVVLYMGVAL